MRTTIEIDDAVMDELRATAHRRRVSLRQVVNEALRSSLIAGRRAAAGSRYRCPTFHLGHPRTPIDLDKALSVAAALEDAEVAHEMELRK